MIMQLKVFEYAFNKIHEFIPISWYILTLLKMQMKSNVNRLFPFNYWNPTEDVTYLKKDDTKGPIINTNSRLISYHILALYSLSLSEEWRIIKKNDHTSLLCTALDTSWRYKILPCIL